MELIKNYNRVDCAYEAPSVKMLDILAEGVLCASFGDANEAGKMLQENENATWEF